MEDDPDAENGEEGDEIPGAMLTIAEGEVNSYLSIRRMQDMNINILDWWKERAARFPYLSHIVRKYFGRPLSSAESERVFSKAGLIYTSDRSSIEPANAESLLIMGRALRASNYNIDWQNVA